jgi:hypothetical protein
MFTRRDGLKLPLALAATVAAAGPMGVLSPARAESLNASQVGLIAERSPISPPANGDIALLDWGKAVVTGHMNAPDCFFKHQI